MYRNVYGPGHRVTAALGAGLAAVLVGVLALTVGAPPSVGAPDAVSRGDALDFRGLPMGEAPKIGYARGTTFKLPGGRNIRGVEGTEIARLSDGRIVTIASGARVTYVNVYRGSMVRTFPASQRAIPRLAVSRSHDTVVWVGRRGVPMALQAGQRNPVRMARPGPKGISVVSVLGRDCTRDPEATGRGCSIFLSQITPRGKLRTWVVSSHGFADVVPGIAATDVRRRTSPRAIGITKITDDSTCSARTTLFPKSGRPDLTTRTCRNALDQFSPNGKRMLAGPAYRDGIGDGEIAIYTRTLRRIVDLRRLAGTHAAFVSEATWEDTNSVLIEGYQDGKWSIVRLNTDGSMEYAVAPRPGSDVDSPYVLETTP
ncbi:MAG: hypothetical protein ACRCYQ_15245 [Nocardioides sp.]